jgi:HK97 family phage major capsid protein
MTVTRSDWQGYPFPPDVVSRLVALGLTGAPFALSLTTQPTNRGVVAWPLVDPEGAAWVGEAQQIPTATLNDDVYTVAACKLATGIELSNESVADSSFNLVQAVGNALRASMGPIIDRAFLYGQAALEPKGVWHAAPEADDLGDLRASAINAWGELAAAGAQPQNVVVFAHPTAIAAEWRRTNDNGTPVHDDQATDAITLGPGIRVVGVPMLTTPADLLVADVGSVFRVVRDDFSIEGSPFPGWMTDTASLRVKGRLTVAAPTPEKSLRKVVGAAPGAAKAAPPALAATAKK